MSTPTVSEELSSWLYRLKRNDLPSDVVSIAGNVLLDIAGLSIGARQRDYTKMVLESWDSMGDCTVLGQTRGLDAAGAAFINGTTAHGEDYDDTFEGAPLHAGASATPAVLAACERWGRSGEDVLLGMVAAIEVMARLARVAPGAIHHAGFQPASVIGCIGAAAGVGVAIGLDERQLANAIGIAGSYSSGLMEFLTDGAWTKRIQPGWSAQAGLRAATLARQGFLGPRTVLEGQNGFFRAFARQDQSDTALVTQELGSRWFISGLAFKLYPCGTMIGPYIDCARAARRDGIRPQDIVRIDCRVAAAVAARQWEPLASKQAPATGFAAKFSAPFGIALGLVAGEAGLGQYTDENASDPELRDVAGKVFFEIDPANPFPKVYTGDLTISLKDGTLQHYFQPFLRGGSMAPPSRQDIEDKFRANTRIGGWPDSLADQLAQYCSVLFDEPNLDGLANFRK